MLPKARNENLTVREMPEETLVYDLKTNKAHCLNRTAALIWRHCDGRTSVGQMASLLRDKLFLPAQESVVHLALEQLSRRDLLQEPFAIAAQGPDRSRRDALKKFAVTVGALPVVMTFAARQARAFGSNQPPLVHCKKSSDCVGMVPDAGECAKPFCFAGGVCGNIAVPDGTKCGGGSGTCQGAICQQTTTTTKAPTCPSGMCNSLADCPSGTIGCSGGTGSGCQGFCV